MSEWFIKIFGSSPTAIFINCCVIALCALIAYAFLLCPVSDIVARVIRISKHRQAKTAFLEITPPRHSEKTPLATQKLFAILRQIISRHEVISLEIASSRDEGIRYLAHLKEADIPVLKKHIASYVPGVHFRVRDTSYKPEVSATGQHQRVYEVKQARHFAFPLYKHENYVEHDPIDYIVGSMTKLNTGETIIMQIVIGRHSSRWSRWLYRKLLANGHAIIENRIQYFLINRWWVWIIGVLYGYFTGFKAGFSVAALLIVVSFFIPKEKQELTPAEQSIYDGALDKLSQPLFNVDIRVFIAAGSPSHFTELSKGIHSSVAVLSVPRFQTLYAKPLYPGTLMQKLEMFKFTNRLPSLFSTNCNVMAAFELGDIYHFPYGNVDTEDVARSQSRTLPSPTDIKQRADSGAFDVLLGQNEHHGTVTPIGLTASERERHMFIVGGTGNGKTTMLKYQIVQDIRNGKGLAVIDPHGDLAEELLEYIPEERKKDLIYLNPDDLDHPIGVNLLELPEGLTGNDLLREKDRVTESVVSVMRKIFSEDDSGGHRIEYVLRNTVQTALTLDKPTLFTIFRLLNDGKFAKGAIKNLEDENLKMFWKDELGKAGSFQKVKMAAGITAKIGRFLFSASARAMLGQEKSTIDFNEILDGKILICNFSKGRLGEDTSTLFGITILAKLQLAALKRSERKQGDRKRFFLYVDEFQNFATVSFTQMLSEARKYKVFLTMAEQSTQQQEDQKLVNIILANVGTVMVFRTGSPKDEDLLLPLFEPYIEYGEISNLPAYNFYIRIQGEKSSEPMSGQTLLVG